VHTGRETVRCIECASVCAKKIFDVEKAGMCCRAEKIDDRSRIADRLSRIVDGRSGSVDEP
jgi:hypothetical protein